ncbi:MAG: hypothetical protein HUU22_01735 [Phycisphaerae bacterium]|nr:hypothetical protein [Phycisphaerae bacterium]NUQ44736.1 hypothetical protein [Phycisphaerae bacterium]
METIKIPPLSEIEAAIRNRRRELAELRALLRVAQVRELTTPKQTKRGRKAVADAR